MRIAPLSQCVARVLVAMSQAAKPPEIKQTCIFILTQIDVATQRWALEHNNQGQVRAGRADVPGYCLLPLVKMNQE
jgi:hypothetical protein